MFLWVYIDIHTRKRHIKKQYKCRVATMEQYSPKCLPNRMGNQPVTNNPAIYKKELPVRLWAVVAGLGNPAAKAIGTPLFIDVQNMFDKLLADQTTSGYWPL